MRYIRPATQLFLAALVAVGLSACDFSEQNYDIEPGDALQIEPASGFGDQVPDVEEDSTTHGFQRFVPAGASSFYIIPFTIEKEYTWTVTDADGNELERSTRRDGEYMDVTFAEPDEYTISIESTGQGDEYSGSFQVETVYPAVGTQGGRFSALVQAYGAGDFAAMLAEDDSAPYTVLAPTKEALTTAIDTTEEGELKASPAFLEDVAQYHVLMGEVSADQVSGASHPTIIAGVDADGSGVTVENGDVPATNGLVHVVDQVLEPPFAIVDFPAQEAAIDEDSGSHTLTVASVYLPEGGYVAIEDGDGDEVARSSELDAGFQNGVTLELSAEVAGEGEYTALLYEGDGTTLYTDKNGDDATNAGIVGPPAE